MEEVFTQFYRDNHWNNAHSRSGQGSDLAATAYIRQQLPRLFERLQIRTLLDIPCGDFFWFSHMPVPAGYIGGDIVPEMIEDNRKLWPELDWRVLDVVREPLPKVDMVFARDIFGHLPYDHVALALRNIERSGSKWLLTTTFPGRPMYDDVVVGGWHPINLEHEYFKLGPPRETIVERCAAGNGKFSDKSLGLWRLDGK
jgi:SAM-dependent methyltransferase